MMSDTRDILFDWRCLRSFSVVTSGASLPTYIDRGWFSSVSKVDGGWCGSVPFINIADVEAPHISGRCTFAVNRWPFTADDLCDLGSWKPWFCLC